MMCACWGNALGGTLAYNQVNNLRKVKHGLVMWQKNERRNEQKKICCPKKVICDAYQQPVFDGQQIQELEEDLTRAIRRE